MPQIVGNKNRAAVQGAYKLASIALASGAIESVTHGMAVVAKEARQIVGDPFVDIEVQTEFNARNASIIFGCRR